jgi:hypothetical protein
MPLQEYRGYTVDYRLKQFRKCPPDHGIIEFIDFKSWKGDELLCEMLEKNLVPEDKISSVV